MFLRDRKENLTQLNFYIMPENQVQIKDLESVRARYLDNLKSCVSSSMVMLQRDKFSDFAEQFSYAVWYFEKIKGIDFQLGVIGVDRSNFDDK